MVLGPVMATKTRRKRLKDNGLILKRSDETIRAFKALAAAGGTPPQIDGCNKKKRVQTHKRRKKLNSAEVQRTRLLKDLQSDLPAVAAKFWSDLETFC